MFWHTARDDTLFTYMRCIFMYEDTQVYATILPTELTNQAMLESKAYQTYYAFASLEKAPKPKYIQKKTDSDTSPKKNPVQATKGTRLKSKAKVAKLDKKKQPSKKTKAKGLAVLSEVALTEAEQLKLATKRTKTQFHSSHASGSGDGIDTQSKVPDEQQQKSFRTDERTGTKPWVPDVPIYESKSEKQSWGDSEDEDNENNSDDVSDDVDDGDNDDDDGDSDDHDDDSDDHDDDSDDERSKSDRDEILDLKLTNVDQTEHEEEVYDDEFYKEEDDEENMDDEEDDEVIKELYDDVNQEEDAHVTLTSVIEAQKADEPVQSSFVSSDFTRKLLNLENPSPTVNVIDSLLETSTHHATAIPEITSGFTTTTPPPTPFFNPILQQQTPTFTTTTSTNPTMTLPEIPNFASIFKFDQRVSAFESEMSEFKQTNQFAEVVSSILGIVDTYLTSKMKEAVDVDVDSTMKTIIKDQVKTQVSKIMPKIEKYVTESLEAEVLVRSTNQPQTAYAVAASLPEFELKKGRDDQDKDEDPSAGLNQWRKKRRKSGKDVESSKDSRSKEKKSSSTSKDASQSQHKSSGKSIHAEEPSYTVEDSGMQQDQDFVTRDNDEQPADKEVTKADWFKKPERPPTPDLGWSKRQQVDFRPPQTWISQAALAEEPPTSFDEFNDTLFDFFAFVLNRLKIPNLTQEILVGPTFNLLKGTYKSITKLEYHLEECSKETTERLDWHNPENKLYLFDLRKPLSLIQDHQGRQIIPKDYFINEDPEYLKGGDFSRCYSTSVTKSKAANYKLKWIKDLVPELWSPVQMHDYGHLEEIEVCRDDQKPYTFKEGDFKRLRLQDIKDMLLLLVQQKLTNLTINERYDLNVELPM
ncbi:hypothetical protein Tco_0349417 [Tanacetum coccineum]